MSLQANGMAAGLHWLEEARIRLSRGADAHVLFAHIGPIDHRAVERLVALAERSCLSASDPAGARKRLINVLVEGLENVHHHAHPSSTDTSMALLVADREGYRFAMGNAMPYATAALLTHRIGILNEMDESELRDTYLKLLANEARSEHGGAGLGLLTIARKSLRPMIMRSAALDDALAYFRLELSIDRRKSPAAKV